MTSTLEGASSFASVLAAVHHGQTVGAAARSLGISVDLAEAMFDEAKRLGLAASASDLCGTCTVSQASITCAGCPIAMKK